MKDIDIWIIKLMGILVGIFLGIYLIINNIV